MGISQSDARSFCKWRTRILKNRGRKVTARLPTEAEWEKAARGVDGRAYPWGNRFDFSFTHGGMSQPGIPWPLRKGSFPKDRSPYGVQDMAGSRREWCLEILTGFGDRCISKG